MKEKNLFNLIEKNLFSVQRSYHEIFKDLNEEDFKSLSKHQSFLKKVHEELKSEVTISDLLVFEQNLLVFQNSGKDFKNLYTSVFNKDDINNNCFFEKFITKNKRTTSKEFNPIYAKILNKSGMDSWALVNKCLYKHTEVFNIEAIQNLANGFALKNLLSFNRLVEAINYVATFLKDILTSLDFVHILNLCKTNEKFVFVLLYPYLIKPLGKIMWTTLLPHFHFVFGSFSHFFKKVSEILRKNATLNKTYITLSVKRSTKIALGVCTAGLFAFISKSLMMKTKPIFVTNGKLYEGLSGTLGFWVSFFRLECSKVIYEIAKTVSTFSNAAIAGAFEPKKDVIAKILESSMISKLIKNFKK